MAAENIHAQLFAAPPGSAFPISDQELIFQPDDREDRHVMTQEVYSALNLCSNFAELGRHTSELIAQNPKLERAQISRVLENLCQRGLLQPASVLTAAGLAGAKPGALRTIAILTSGHPAQLEACLASLREADSGREFGIVLADIADNVEHRAKKLELIADFGRKTGQRIVVLEQKLERWLAERESAHPHLRQGLAQLFGKHAAKRARALNAIALVCAGERVLMLDDSQRLRLFGPKNWREMPLILEQTTPRVPRFFQSPEAATSGSEQAGSLWSVADTWLGRSIGPLLSQLDVEGMRWAELAAYQNARVQRLALGAVGSADTEHSLWLFRASQAELANFADRGALDLALSGSAVTLQYGALELSAGIGASAQAIDFTVGSGFALGNGEDADRSFSALTAGFDPRNVELRMPLGLERRSAAALRAQTNREPPTPSFERFFADQINDIAPVCHAHTQGARARWLSAQMQDFAESANQERQSILWRYLTAQRAGMLNQLQSYLVNAGAAPEPLRHELLNTIKMQAEAGLQMRLPSLRDTPVGLNAVEISNWLQGKLIDAASAISTWGALQEDADLRRID